MTSPLNGDDGLSRPSPEPRLLPAGALEGLAGVECRLFGAASEVRRTIGVSPVDEEGTFDRSWSRAGPGSENLTFFRGRPRCRGVEAIESVESDGVGRHDNDDTGECSSLLDRNAEVLTWSPALERRALRSAIGRSASSPIFGGVESTAG